MKSSLNRSQVLVRKKVPVLKGWEAGLKLDEQSFHLSMERENILNDSLSVPPFRQKKKKELYLKRRNFFSKQKENCLLKEIP